MNETTYMSQDASTRAIECGIAIEQRHINARNAVQCIPSRDIEREIEIQVCAARSSVIFTFIPCHARDIRTATDSHR